MIKVNVDNLNSLGYDNLSPELQIFLDSQIRNQTFDVLSFDFYVLEYLVSKLPEQQQESAKKTIEKIKDQKDPNVSSFLLLGKPLIFAFAGNGINDGIKILLRMGADVNKDATEMDSPILYAVMNNHLETVELLYKISDVKFLLVAYRDYINADGINPQIFEILSQEISVKGNDEQKDKLLRIKNENQGSMNQGK